MKNPQWSRKIENGGKLRKCLFGAETIDFLGIQLKRGIIGFHEDNVEKIQNAPRPLNKT